MCAHRIGIAHRPVRAVCDVHNWVIGDHDHSKFKSPINRKVVLVIFTKEQKVLSTVRYAFEVTYIEKQTINVDA